jgi:hypothetical protein
MVSTLPDPSNPSPSFSPSSDVEAQAQHEHPHHHERTYPEAELSNTAVVWDQELREWRSQDEAERDSDVTTVGGDGGTHTATTATPGEKRLSVEGNAEKGNSAKVEKIWVEWDGANDPENPFNVSPLGVQLCSLGCELS